MHSGRVVALAAALGYAVLALASGADRAAATNAAKAERLPRALAAQSLAVAGDRVIVCQNLQSIEAKNRLGMPVELPMTIESFYPFLTKNEIKPTAVVAAGSSVESSITF